MSESFQIHLDPSRESFSFQRIHYPEWTETRDDAQARTHPLTTLECTGCNHKIDFQSHAEKARFIASSRWVDLDPARQYTREPAFYCPVCQKQSPRAAGPRGGISSLTKSDRLGAMNARMEQDKA